MPDTNGNRVAASAALDDWAKDEKVHGEIDPEEGGWDLDVTAADAHEDQQETSSEFEDVTDLRAGASPGVRETDLWVRNSQFPGDHVAADSFESEMQVSWTALSWEQPF